MDKNILSSLSLVNKQVLVALMEKEEPVSTQFLADELSLSVSQVRYSIKKLQACLQFKDIHISQKQNEGVIIEISRENRENLIRELEENIQDINALNPPDRINLLLQMILTQSGAKSYTQIREATNITSTSLYRDFLGVQEWLRERNLDLQIRRNLPLEVTGEESIIRKAIQEICLENLGQNYFVQACVFPFEMIEMDDYCRKIFSANIGDFVQSINLPECEKQVRLIEEKNSINFLDAIHLELSLLLGITIQRINKGYLIADSEYPVISKGDHYTDAIQALQGLIHKFDEHSLRGEIFHLAKKIAYGLQKSFFDNQNVHGQSHSAGADWEKTAIRMVNECGKYFHAGLCEDRELINCIKWELAYFFGSSQPLTLKKREIPDQEKPLSLRKIISNIVVPILCEEGYETGVELYESIENHILTALEKIKQSYAHRRVLLVCGSGFATAVTLQRQLMTKLPEIDIIGVASVFELAHNPAMLDDCDAVISTIPLGRITRIPQYLVSALLTDDDVDMIRKTLGLHMDHAGEDPIADETSLSLSNIISVETIKNNISFDSPEAVIDETGNLLLSINAIWPSYIRAMKNMYKLYGPYMVIAPNTALFHAGPEMGAKKPGISLVTLSKPIRFGHKDFDPVKIAMAFSIPNHLNQVRALSDVFNFFADKSNREKIIGAADPRETIKIIQKDN